MDPKLLPAGSDLDEAVVACGGLDLDHTGMRTVLAALTHRDPVPTWVRFVDTNRRTVSATLPDGAATIGIPVTDATKRLDGDTIVETLDRRSLFTPALPIRVPVEAVRRALTLAEGPDIHLATVLALAEPFAVVPLR